MILQPAILALVLGAQPSPIPAPVGHYEVLTCKVDTPPPFALVSVARGPREEVAGVSLMWWQLDIHRSDKPEDEPLVRIRALTSSCPFESHDEPIRFEQYLVKVPPAGETLEYRNLHTGRALLPGWGGFQRHFLPRLGRGSPQQAGFPETCEYLGHVLTLRSVGKDARWEDWSDVKLLKIDPELLVGTGRGFKDKEGHRLPQSPANQNYTYAMFTQADYDVMFEAGMNLFCVEPDQERIVRVNPVFYIRGIGEGKTVLQYPADLYRSNYLGPVMFMDEPAILLMADKNTGGRVWYPSDAATAIEKRVRATYNSDRDYGRYLLERPNSGQQINVGDMRIDQYDFPSWETVYETAFYQMAGGCNGIVHEGRYQLAEFDKAVAQITGEERKHTPEQVLRYHYAFLRGAVRPFSKYWGTAIYGQCDPSLAPGAVTLAYDMGARYIWYWTSDHGHHLPWVEQVELSRALRKHAANHPRPTISGSVPMLDKAIVLPYGMIASLDGLRWVRVKNDENSSQRGTQKQLRLMKHLLALVHEAFDANEDFDITIDDGREITGYRKMVKVTDTP